MRFWATVSLLFLTLGAYGLSLRRNPDSLAAPLDSISSHVTGWTEIATEQLPPQTLEHLIPTSYLVRTYTKDNSQLGLFIAYYAQQRAGESMHSPKHCLPGSGWEIWKHGSAMVPVNGRQVEIN